MSDPKNPRQLLGLDLDNIIQVLVSQRWTFLSFLGAVLLAALVGSLLTEKQYQAVALIQLMPQAGQEVESSAVVKYDDAGYMERRDRARTQIQIILSRSVREEALRRYAEAGYTDMDVDSGGRDRLKEGLSAGPREDTQLVEIRVLHSDPKQAAVLANLVAEVYRDANLEARTDAAKETRVWLEGQTSSYQETLEQASAKVMAFKEGNDLGGIDQKVDDITQRMQSLQRALGETTTERVLLEATLREHERLLKAGEYGVLAGMFADPALGAMSKQHATIVTEAADVLARYGEKHPEHQRVMDHIRRVEALIAVEVERNVDAERSKLRTLRRQEGQINEELEEVKVEYLAKERLTEQYANLKLEEDRARRLFGSLGERGADVDLQARTRLNDVRIVDEALPPGRPTKPNIPLNMAMALIVGLAGGFGLALLRHGLNDTILTAQDVERDLDAPLLGVLPRLPADLSENERTVYSYNFPRSLPAEALRGVRAMLHMRSSRGVRRRLLITSSIKGEGKSDVAVGLAIAFARLGSKTLLIDADMRLPRLHRVFETRQAPGLSDALQRPDHEQVFAWPTPVQNLHIMTCGNDVDNPNELLSTGNLEILLNGLSASYDIIIVDSPPAALVADALAIARAVDGVVLVARCGKVTRGLARQSLAQLRKVGGGVLGVVLNDVPPHQTSTFYGSAYYKQPDSKKSSAQ